MTERDKVDPRFLTPEYWAGHGVDDDCSGREAYDWPRGRQVKKVRKFGRNALQEYLGTGERTIMRTYKPGELFEVRDYPEGTILYFEQEELMLAKPDSFKKDGMLDRLESNALPESPYGSHAYWAVIAGYKENGKRKKTVIRFEANPDHLSGFHPYGQPLTHPDIRIGEIQHRRPFIDNEETLRRILTLQVHHMGSGVREESRATSFLPRLGTIFHRA